MLKTSAHAHTRTTCCLWHLSHCACLCLPRRFPSLPPLPPAALTMLRQIMMNSLGVTDPNLEDQVLDQSLKLVINCLSYDFIGTNPDEATDDVGTIQLPLRWRSIVVNPETLKVFFGMYRGCCTGSFQMSAGSAAAAATVGMGAGASTTGTERASITVRPKRAAQVMECLTLLISVRRSIFAKDEQRLTFLLRVVTGLCEVMRDELVRTFGWVCPIVLVLTQTWCSVQGMADSDCYHQFCRLLGKIKRVYQLSDLLRTVSYTEWIALAADFAMKSFRNLHVRVPCLFCPRPFSAPLTFSRCMCVRLRCVFVCMGRRQPTPSTTSSACGRASCLPLPMSPLRCSLPDPR